MRRSRCKTVYKIDHITVMGKPGVRLKLQAADSERVVSVANVCPGCRCLIQRVHNFRVADNPPARPAAAMILIILPLVGALIARHPFAVAARSPSSFR